MWAKNRVTSWSRVSDRKSIGREIWRGRQGPGHVGPHRPWEDFSKRWGWLLLCCWKRMFAMTSAFSWQNSISFCPASFHIPKPNLPVTPGNSCDHRTLFSPQESPYRKICVNNGWSPCGFHVNEVKSCNPVMKWLGWSRYKKIWNICRVLFRLD